MSHKIVACALLVGLWPAVARGQAGGRQDTLTNAGVIDMVTAKLPRDLIIQKIKSTPAAFDVTALGLVKLTGAGVPHDIMKMMMESPQGAATPQTPPPSAPPPTAVAPPLGPAADSPPSASPTAPAKRPAALAQDCKPDAVIADKISKEKPVIWSQVLYTPGMINNGDVSQATTIGVIGTYGIVSTFILRIHRSEQPGMAQGYEARKGDRFSLGMKDGGPLEFATAYVNNDVTKNMNSGKLVTDIELWASLSDDQLTKLRDALTTRQIDAVRVSLERGVEFEQSISDKNSKAMMAKFACFYEARDDGETGAGATPSSRAARVSGMYVQRDTASTRMEFRPGGTAHFTLAGHEYEGYYRIRGDTITIQIPGARATHLTISTNELVGSDGAVYVRQAAAPRGGRSTAPRGAPAAPRTNKPLIW
jgi:hypothetical protein